MIVLDTHIWVWWVHGDRRLRASSLDLLKENETSGLGVSIISCWEVAKLVEYKRLDLPALVDEWIEQALQYPGIVLLELTPRIVVEATRLPGSFHRGPGRSVDRGHGSCSRKPPCHCRSQDPGL